MLFFYRVSNVYIFFRFFYFLLPCFCSSVVTIFFLFCSVSSLFKFITSIYSSLLLFFFQLICFFELFRIGFISFDHIYIYLFSSSFVFFVFCFGFCDGQVRHSVPMGKEPGEGGEEGLASFSFDSDTSSSSEDA